MLFQTAFLGGTPCANWVGMPVAGVAFASSTQSEGGIGGSPSLGSNRSRDRSALARALDLVSELIRREREPIRVRPAAPAPHAAPPLAAPAPAPLPVAVPPPSPAPPPPAPAPAEAPRAAPGTPVPAEAPRAAPVVAPAPPPSPLPVPSPAQVVGLRSSPPYLAQFAVGLFEEAPFAALLCDATLRILSLNTAAQALFGFSSAEALGKDLASLFFAERDRHAVRSELEAVLAQGRSEQSLRISASRTGEARLDEWTVVPLRDESGAGGAAILVRELFAPHDRYAAASQAAGDAVWDWDLVKDRLWLSGAWTALSGVSTDGEEPGAWLDRVHPSDCEPLQAAIQAHLDGQSPRFENEHRLRHQGGGWRYVLARGKAVRDPAGKAIRFCGTLMDITARRAAADRVLHDALHDPLTRLPNRNLFLDLVKRSFARARRREGYTFAVLFLDLDHFKSVNDGLGHAAGDELLLQMARRLQLCLREGDTLARQGGDEFTILLDDVKDPIDAQLVASRIHEATSQPFEIGGHEVFATTSIGIALSAPSYSRPEDLLLDADTAMYRAKAQGRARSVVFDASMRERSPQLLHLEADLRRALLRDEFRVQYLPIFDVATGNVLGLEALLRWAHPKRGLLQPDAFVPFAEETGLIVPIGRWLLAQAGRDFQGCRRLPGYSGLRLHVNMSSKQLLQTDLLQHLESVLQQHQLVPADLAVELTERTLQEGEPTVSRVAELRERGVRLYVDDFGSGFSSLSSLHRFQLDSLKIDQSLFVAARPRARPPTSSAPSWPWPARWANPWWPRGWRPPSRWPSSASSAARPPRASTSRPRSTAMPPASSCRGSRCTEAGRTRERQSGSGAPCARGARSAHHRPAGQLLPKHLEEGLARRVAGVGHPGRPHPPAGLLHLEREVHHPLDPGCGGGLGHHRQAQARRHERQHGDEVARLLHHARPEAVAGADPVNVGLEGRRARGRGGELDEGLVPQPGRHPPQQIRAARLRNRQDQTVLHHRHDLERPVHR